MTRTTRRSELWQRLRIARGVAGLTQMQLADKMHISRPAVAFWENKNPAVRTQMDTDQMQRYSVAVNIPLALLMDDTLTDVEFEEAARSRVTLAPGDRTQPPRASNAQATGLAFFSAVTFGVLAQAPELSPAFEVEAHVGGLGLVASFAVPGHIVQFVIQQSGQVEGGDQLQIVRETGYLLLIERALSPAKAFRGAQKHLILYTPTRSYSMAGREDYEAAFGVQLHVGGDVGSTVQYLLNMV